MKTIHIYTLVLCCLISMSAKAWQDGDTIKVKRDNGMMLLTPNDEIASLNLSFSPSTNGEIFGVTHITGDTMSISYYEDHLLIKKETYQLKEDGNMAILGSQTYFVNDKPFCEDMFRKGSIVCTTWFDAKGDADRRYIYSANRLAMRSQSYPSGEKMSLMNYAHDTVIHYYDKSGKEAVFVEATPINGFDSFEKFFNSKFRANRLYTKETFTACITVDTTGECSALIFKVADNAFYRLNCQGAPRWHPATINGHPVRSTLYRQVHYNPIAYLDSNDTIPARNMVSTLASYMGIQWLRTRMYTAVPADTCSHVGVYSHSDDTTIFYCWNKTSGDKLCHQCYVMDNAGIPIKEGRFSYYANNKKEYEELFANDTVIQTIHYYDNEMPKWMFTKERTSQRWDTMRTYYSDGTLQSLSIPQKKKSKVQTTYFDKQGNPTKDVVLPQYPGGATALNRHLQYQIPIKDSKFWKIPLWKGELRYSADFFVEIDETGKPTYVGVVSASCKYHQTYKELTTIDLDLLHNLLKETVYKNPVLWKPGRINGDPTTLRTKIHIDYYCFK